MAEIIQHPRAIEPWRQQLMAETDGISLRSDLTIEQKLELAIEATKRHCGGANG